MNQTPLAEPPAPHALSISETLNSLRTSLDGLTPDEVARRRVEWGPNSLPRAKREGPLLLLWRQINNPLIWVLLASSAVAAIVDWDGDGPKNGIVILAVVIINSCIGFLQEWRAGRAIESLSQMVPERVTVVRQGTAHVVPAADLVPGDIVRIASGDHVPADLRLVEERRLHIDEAMLTGESVAAIKDTDATDAQAALGDRTCSAFAGTLVTTGTGVGVVTATGTHTELGKISSLLHQATDLETPLTKALGEIGRYITIGILLITALMLAVGVGRTMWETGADPWTAFRETLIFAIALAVGAIPEGLPAIVTISLAIGVRRMARRRAIVRKLPAVETLGGTTVICTDKTGTLTRNEMTVQSLWTPRASYSIEGVGYEPQGALINKGQQVPADEDVQQLLRAAALCGDATLREEDGRWRVTGDPTEGAMVVAAAKIGLHLEALEATWPRIDAVPFESENQWMATLHHGEQGGYLFVKGAPEVIARMCQAVDREALGKQVAHMASQGLRVLAVAQRQWSDNAHPRSINDDLGQLELLGLLGMIDPPREEAIQAIEICRAAGVRVKMITGDHRITAAAIGEQLGLLSAHGAIDGTALSQMDDDELRRTATSANVFARVAPEHKLRLVRALQAEGEVVAMTGDGVNDAPALKQANIGVAMGITGTAASKQAADIVLTDDNFASIGAAVEEGRRVYDNLIKSLTFVLPTNLGLALILVCSVAFFPFNPDTGELLLALSPIQLLWINLVATVSLALPLAFEAAEPDVMQRPPRPPQEQVLGGFVIKRTTVVAFLMTIAACGVFFWEYQAELNAGQTASIALAEAQTITVTTIVIFQCFYLANCRSLRHSFLSVGAWSNPWFYVGVFGVLVLQLGFIYLPPAHTLFSSSSLNTMAWLKALIVGAVILPIIMFEKRIVRPLGD